MFKNIKKTRGVIFVAKKETYVILYPGDVADIIVKVNARGQKSAFAKAKVATGKPVCYNTILHKVGSCRPPHPKIREYLKEHGLRYW